eukprot:TRINITY_DN4194_c0_g1_i5.p2 TRINITY_DN4194_c0_g1~~TRINITY_DN4194_c0_g1_i5.p2  ORF type:complete len:187 (+),score=25.75 TRINITY_DN4194_c0_g1_i5:63-563(+)
MDLGPYDFPSHPTLESVFDSPFSTSPSSSPSGYFSSESVSSCDSPWPVLDSKIAQANPIVIATQSEFGTIHTVDSMVFAQGLTQIEPNLVFQASHIPRQSLTCGTTSNQFGNYRTSPPVNLVDNLNEYKTDSKKRKRDYLLPSTEMLTKISSKEYDGKFFIQYHRA